MPSYSLGATLCGHFAEELGILNDLESKGESAVCGRVFRPVLRVAVVWCRTWLLCFWQACDGAGEEGVMVEGKELDTGVYWRACQLIADMYERP